MSYNDSTLSNYFASSASDRSAVVPNNLVKDIVSMYVFTSTNVTPTSPGFTAKANSTYLTNTGHTGKLSLLWKRVKSAIDTGSYTVSFSGTTESMIGLLSHSGRLAVGDPFSFVDGHTTAAATQPGASSGTCQNFDDLFYAPFEFAGVTGMTASGYTQRKEGASTGGHLFTADFAGAGPVTAQASATASNYWYTLFGGLKYEPASPIIGYDFGTSLKTISSTANVQTSVVLEAGNRVCVLIVTNKPSAGDAAVASVASTGTGLTWAKRAYSSLNGGTSGAGATGTSAEIWEATSPIDQTVTITTTPNAAATTSTWELITQVVVCRGVEASFTGSVLSAHSASGLPSLSLPMSAGSQAIAVVADWNTGGAGTYPAGTTTIVDTTDAQFSWHMWQLTAPKPTAGNQTLNLTAPSAQNYNMVAIEIKVASPLTVMKRAPLVVNRAALIRASSF